MAKPASRVLRTGGLYFNGVNDYMVVWNRPELNPTQELTIIVWVKFQSLSANGVVYLFDKGWNDQFCLTYNWAHVYFRVWNQDKSAVAQLDFGEKRTFTAEVWYCFAAVVKMSENTVKGYKNGILVDSRSLPGSAIRTSSVNILIGTPTGVVPAVIDEVRFYNRALSADEIYEIYSKGTFIKDGLVLYLPFYEGEGNIAHDVSGYGNHGTIYGASWVVKKALRVLPKAG